MGCSRCSQLHPSCQDLVACTHWSAPQPGPTSCPAPAALLHRIQPSSTCLLPQTLYNFGLTAKPFCSYRMSDALAGSLGIDTEVAEVRFAPSASGVRCRHV